MWFLGFCVGVAFAEGDAFLVIVGLVITLVVKLTTIITEGDNE